MSMVAYPDSLFSSSDITFVPNKGNGNLLAHRIRLIPLALIIFSKSLKSFIKNEDAEFYFSLPSSAFMHMIFNIISLGKNKYLDDGIRFITLEKTRFLSNKKLWLRSQFSDANISIPKENLISLECSNKSIFLGQLIEFTEQTSEHSRKNFLSELNQFLSNEKNLIYLEHPKASFICNNIHKNLKNEFSLSPKIKVEFKQAIVDGTKRQQFETTTNLITFWSSAILLQIFNVKPERVTFLSSNILKQK